MAGSTANINPIYASVPLNGFASLSAANVRNSGTGTIGTDIFLAFTAGTDGSWVSKARINIAATTAATVSSATVIRLYLSSLGSGATTGGTDTWLIGEVAIPSLTVDQTTTANPFYEIPLGFAIPSGYRVLASTHIVPAANTTHQVIVFGGNY